VSGEWEADLVSTLNLDDATVAVRPEAVE